MLPIVVVAALASCDGPSTSADRVPSTFTTDAPSAASDTATAEQFIAALNDRDAAAAGDLVAPGAPIAVSPLAPSEAVDRDVTIAEQIAWLAAWDWNWDDVTCDAGERSANPTSQGFIEGEGGVGIAVEFDATARCAVTARTKLGDVDDVSVTYTITLRLLDGSITYVSTSAPQLRWMPSFLDFKEWAETERTDLWAQAWDDDGPLLTEQSTDIEGQLLDEYISLPDGAGNAPAPTMSAPEEEGVGGATDPTSVVRPSSDAVLESDASGAAATGGTPLPDFDGAIAGDDGGVRLPLGSVSRLSHRDRLDFLHERGGPGKPREAFRDAVFVNPIRSLGATAWQAGRPFVVRHGFVNEGPEPLGPEFDVVVYAFQMDLPGETSGTDIGPTLRFTSDYVLRGETDQCGPNYRTQTAPVTCEWFVHDFPDGLPDEGRWALWAFWQAPCHAWIDLGFVDGCDDPDEALAVFASGVDSPWRTAPVVWDED